MTGLVRVFKVSYELRYLTVGRGGLQCTFSGVNVALCHGFYTLWGCQIFTPYDQSTSENSH